MMIRPSNPLPTPEPEAYALSQQLLADICQEISVQGPMHFARFMDLALYSPQSGYYRSGMQKFGKFGDFVTAPEISPLFSRCIARQCQQVLESLAGGGDILEFGAGSGIMAATILQELAHSQCLPNHYYILELSAELQQRQLSCLQQRVPELVAKVTWLKQLPSPQSFAGIMLANEVIDAMPVHKIYMNNDLKEFYIDCQNEELQWQLGPPSSEKLIQYVADLNIVWPADYETEINLLLSSWLTSLAMSLKHGLILLIDYGYPRHEYYHPDRNRGTIMCHYRHHAHSDPLLYPGIQDITAHVDFTSIAETAQQCGLTISGFTHQAGLLINCGITEMLLASQAEQKDDIARYNLQQQIKQLTLPSEMGETIKAIALTRDFAEPLYGFTDFDQMGRL